MNAPALTQMCLVSAQATPNLTPLLDPNFAPKHVVLVVSADMRDRASWLTEVIKPRGISVEHLAVENPWDVQALFDQFVAWLDPLGDEASVALNLTGGTKPMAIAAQQAFSVANKPIFYVHQDRDEILWLTPRRPAEKLANRMKLKPFLHAHGWQVMEQADPPMLTTALRILTDELVLQVGSLSKPLGTLNWYANRCQENSDLSCELSANDLKDEGLMALIQKFSTAGACVLKNTRLVFPDEAARFFCNGGWLEHHVTRVLRDLQPTLGIQDLATGLKVRSLDNKKHGNAGSNELDVVFLAHNHLHIVECKTRNFKENDSAADAVYKLDSLTGLGGIKTKALLASYRNLRDGDLQRAKDLSIHTVCASALTLLPTKLQAWIK
jgi:hypothetical protein